MVLRTGLVCERDAADKGRAGSVCTENVTGGSGGDKCMGMGAITRAEHRSNEGVGVKEGGEGGGTHSRHLQKTAVLSIKACVKTRVCLQIFSIGF